MMIDLWIFNSVLLIRSVGSLLVSPPFIALIGCFILLIVAKILKDIIGG